MWEKKKKCSNNMTEVQSIDGRIVEAEANPLKDMPPSVVSSTVQHHLNEDKIPKHQSVNEEVFNNRVSTILKKSQTLCNAAVTPVCEKKVCFSTTNDDENDAPLKGGITALDFILGKDISTSDRENVCRKMSELPDDDFLSFVQPFVRENSNDGDAVFVKTTFQPKYLCVTVQTLSLSIEGRQNVLLHAQNPRLSSLAFYQQLVALPYASYFVEYEVPAKLCLLRPNMQKSMRLRPWIPKMHRLCSKRQIRDKVYFGESSFHRLPSKKEVFQEIFNQNSLTFKVYSRYLNQRVPSLIGECVTSLVGIRESMTLSKEVELPLYSPKFTILGFLSVKMELVADITGSKCILTPPTRSLDIQTKPKEGLTRDSDLHDQPNHTAEKSDKISAEKKQANLPSQILNQKILLHCFLHIVEGRGFKPMTSVLLSRGFWKSDVAASNVCWNTSTPEYNFHQMIPVELSETLLNRCCCSFMVTEVWTQDGLLGIMKLPLNTFYTAYLTDFGVEQIKSNKYPVTCVDGWVDVVDPPNFQVVGQLLVLLAMGTEEQIMRMNIDLNRKLEIVAPPPSPFALDVTAVTHLSELDFKEENVSELYRTVNILSKQHIPCEQNEQEIVIAHFSQGKVLSSSGTSQEITVKQTQSSDNRSEKVMPLTVMSFASGVVQSHKPQNMPQCHQQEDCYQRDSLSKPQYVDLIQIGQRYFERCSENIAEFCDDSTNNEQSKPTPENVHSRFELGHTVDESCSSFSSKPLKQLRVPVIRSDTEGLGTAANEYQGRNKSYYISKTDLANRQQPYGSERLHRGQQLPSLHNQEQCMKSCVCQSKHSIGTNTSTALVEELNIGQGYEKAFSAVKMSLISDLVMPDEDLDDLEKILFFRTDKEIQTELASFPHIDKSTNTTSAAKEEKDCKSLSCTTSELNPTKSFLKENATTQTELDDKNSFHVLIEVESAIHLPLLDSGMAPNPYVTFKVDHGLGVTTVATPVVTQSTEPAWQWNHETWLSSHLLLEESKCLIMKLWHKVDITSQDPDTREDIVIGFIAVDLSVLLYGMPQIMGWFNINDLTGHCMGQIKINVVPLEKLTRFRNQAVNVLQSSYTEEDQPRKYATQHLNVHGASSSLLNDLLKPCSFTSIQNVLESDSKMGKDPDSTEFEGSDQASESLYVNTEKDRKILFPSSSAAAATKTSSIKSATAMTTTAGEYSDNMTLNSDVLGDKFADKSLTFLSETLKQTLSEMDEITKRLKERLETVIHKEDNSSSCYSCLEDETDVNHVKTSCDILPLHATSQLTGEDSKCVDNNAGNRSGQSRKSPCQDPQSVMNTKYPFQSSQRALGIKYHDPHQREKATSEEETQEKQAVPIRTPTSSIFSQEQGAGGGSTSTDCLMQMAAEEDGLENIFNPMLFQHLLSCYRDTYQCILRTAPGIHVGKEKQHVAFPYRGDENNVTGQIKGKIVGGINIAHNLVCDDRKSNPTVEYKNQTFQSKNINQTYYSGDIILSSTKRLVNTGTHLASGDAKAQVTRYLSQLRNEHRQYSGYDNKPSSPTEAVTKESRLESNLALKMGYTNDKEGNIMPSLNFPLDNGGNYQDSSDLCSDLNYKLSNVNEQFDEHSKSRIAADQLVTEEQNSTANMLRKSYLEESQSNINFLGSESESSSEVHSISQTREIPFESDNSEVETTSTTTLPHPTTTRQEDTVCTGRSRAGVHQVTPLLIDRDEIRRIAKLFNPRMKDDHTY